MLGICCLAEQLLASQGRIRLHVVISKYEVWTAMQYTLCDNDSERTFEQPDNMGTGGL